MGKTKIEWTEKTWNPIRGCSRVSEGCRHCYAEKMAGRFGGPGQPYEGLVQLRSGWKWTGEIRVVHEAMDEPKRWRKPAMVFVCSMSDLFHERLPFDRIDLVFNTMLATPQHTYQILTKRPARMAAYVADRFHPSRNPLPRHIWLGTSVENQDTADQRIEDLLTIEHEPLFLSMEPLLGPIVLNRWMSDEPCPACQAGDCPEPHIGWVIVGGESGPGARPMHPDWVRQIRDRCVASETPFFFKQWGAWEVSPRRPQKPESRYAAVHYAGTTAFTKDNPFDPFSRGHPNWVMMRRVGKKMAGRELDRKTWSEMPL